MAVKFRWQRLAIAGGAALLGAVVIPTLGMPLVRLATATEASPPAKSKPVTPTAKPVKTAAAAVQPVSADGAYVVKHILDIKGPLRVGDYYWNEAGAPAGPIVITVDLKAGVLSAFRSGYEIGTAAILYGADDYPTPLGVFRISQKDAKHVSNLYNAPMPFMMRLTNDGVTIHGTNMKLGWATHGCVGIPTELARRIFAQVKLGDTVIITNGERLGIGQAIKAA